MSIYDYKTLTRSYTVGEFSFTLGLNRLLALEGFKIVPEYWDLSHSEVAKEMSDKEFSYVEAVKKDPKRIVLYQEHTEKIKICNSKIVEYLLPKMLEKGGTDIKGYNSYEEYAKEFLIYCADNGILDDWLEEIDESEIPEIANEEEVIDFVKTKYQKGMYSRFMEFINLGFSQGSSPSKPKIKITVV